MRAGRGLRRADRAVSEVIEASSRQHAAELVEGVGPVEARVDELRRRPARAVRAARRSSCRARAARPAPAPAAPARSSVAALRLSAGDLRGWPCRRAARARRARPSSAEHRVGGALGAPGADRGAAALVGGDQVDGSHCGASVAGEAGRRPRGGGARPSPPTRSSATPTRLGRTSTPSWRLERLGEAGDVLRGAAQHDVRDLAAALLGAVEVERVAHLAGDLADAVLEHRPHVGVGRRVGDAALGGAAGAGGRAPR